MVCAGDPTWPATCRCSYTNWTSSAHSCDDFYTDRQAINLYKNHVTRVLTRVNTVTGVAYNRDDTIFGEPCVLACILAEPHACSLAARSRALLPLFRSNCPASAALLHNDRQSDKVILRGRLSTNGLPGLGQSCSAWHCASRHFS